MKLEDLVTNRELSQKLKDLGVPQNSHFYWRLVRNGEYRLEHYGFKDNVQDGDISAFLSSELDEMLPSWVYTNKDDETNKSYTCWFGDENTPSDIVYSAVDGEENIIQAENEVDAGGKMLAFLLENNYIDVSKLRSDL